MINSIFSETLLAGSEALLAGSEALLAGSEAPHASSEALLAGWGAHPARYEASQRCSFLPVLQLFLSWFWK